MLLAGSITTAVVGGIYLRVASKTDRFELTHAKETEELISQCPSLTATFEVPKWFTGDIFTVYGKLFRFKSNVKYTREYIGKSAVDFLSTGKDKLVLLIPGLLSSSEETYLKNAALHLSKLFDVGVLNFPGYGSKLSADLVWFDIYNYICEVMTFIKEHYSEQYKKIYMIGYSNGGNFLTHYLARPENIKPDFVITVSQNFNAVEAYSKISSVYESRFVQKLKEIHRVEFGIELTGTTMREIEESISFHKVGVKTLEELYDRFDCRECFDSIKTPMLIILARDDPITRSDFVPLDVVQTNPNIIIAMSETGGHIGWVTKKNRFYADEVSVVDSICLEILSAYTRTR